jgi:prepilin-type N-terminal cleavage/methylation domain-containing protein
LNRQKGFTLLEVMIAAAIMAMGIVAALELFGGSLRLAGNASQQSAATVLCRSLVDEELWRNIIEENERSGTEGLFSWSVSTHPIDRELIGRDEQEQAELHDLTKELGLWLIRADVRWQAASGEKSIEFETARIGKLPQ